MIGDFIAISISPQYDFIQMSKKFPKSKTEATPSYRLSNKILPTPQSLTHQINMRQIQPQIKFELMVIRLHMLAQLVERLVVFFLFQMRQFMHDDHPQELDRHVLEYG